MPIYDWSMGLVYLLPTENASSVTSYGIPPDLYSITVFDSAPFKYILVISEAYEYVNTRDVHCSDAVHASVFILSNVLE
jgi:hypothetical protein